MSMIYMGSFKGVDPATGYFIIHFDLLGDFAYGGPGEPTSDYFRLRSADAKFCFPATETQYLNQQIALHPELHDERKRLDELYSRSMLLDRISDSADLVRSMRVLLDKLPEEERNQFSPIIERISGSLSELLEGIAKYTLP
jgi:hypothetical protein